MSPTRREIVKAGVGTLIVGALAPSTATEVDAALEREPYVIEGYLAMFHRSTNGEYLRKIDLVIGAKGTATLALSDYAAGSYHEVPLPPDIAQALSEAITG